MLIFDYKSAEKKFFKRHQFHDFDIEFFESSLNETSVGNLPQEIKDTANVISVFITSEITPKILEQFPNLMIISTRSTGYDHIDIDACCNKNIKVLNVENYGSNSVVQYTFALILALVRRLIPALSDSHAFKFDTNNYVGRELNALTLGVIGTGAIGASVCKIAHAFGMKILAFDYLQRPNLVKEFHIEYTDKESIYKNSDIITLHVPLTKETHHLITKKEFAQMKNTAIIINTARGDLIKSEDLYNALLNHTISGADDDDLYRSVLDICLEPFYREIKFRISRCRRFRSKSDSLAGSFYSLAGSEKCSSGSNEAETLEKFLSIHSSSLCLFSNP